MTYDYTDNKDSLKYGIMTGYRLIHWLADILRNWFSDPINIKDERICRLLNIQDKDNDLNALFDVGTPYAQDSKKACTTPMIIVSLGDTQYPINQVANPGAGPISENGAIPMYMGLKIKSIGCKVSVATESYDGTALLTGLIEDFLNMNENLLVQDNGMLSEFHVTGVSAPVEIKQGTASNAKPVYQSTISISTVGGLCWTTDTQGPVYRGINTTLKLS